VLASIPFYAASAAVAPRLRQRGLTGGGGCCGDADGGSF